MAFKGGARRLVAYRLVHRARFTETDRNGSGLEHFRACRTENARKAQTLTAFGAPALTGAPENGGAGGIV
jgi:hypothetical protein